MNKKLLTFRYVLLDLIAAVVVWVLFMIFRRIVNDGVLVQNITVFVPNFNYYTVLVLFPIFSVFIHYITGYYVNPIKESRFIEILTTLVASLIISIVVFFVLLLDDIVDSYQHYYYSLLVLIGLLFFLTSVVRVIHSSFIVRQFRSKRWTFNTLIVGGGEKAVALIKEVEELQIFNTIVGVIPLKNETLNPDLLGRELGSLNSIEKVINENDIQEVLIAIDDAEDQEIFELINILFPYNIDIKFTPRLYEILTGKVRFEHRKMQPLVSLTRTNMSDWEQSVKRTFDLFFSFLSLIIMLPVLLYFSIIIKLDSKGPVFYKQERVGYQGKKFKMLKFRTMRDDAESGVPRLSSPNDERITKVGKTLRKYRIDEIPQFINIIKGDMSIVGPRPERKYFIDKIVREAPYYCLVYRIKPGLTSWGPIKVGYADSIEKMIERLNYDIVYMENMSLMTDLKILLYTFEILFKGKGV